MNNEEVHYRTDDAKEICSSLRMRLLSRAADHACQVTIDHDYFGFQKAQVVSIDVSMRWCYSSH